MTTESLATAIALAFFVYGVLEVTPTLLRCAKALEEIAECLREKR